MRKKYAALMLVVALISAITIWLPSRTTHLIRPGDEVVHTGEGGAALAAKLPRETPTPSGTQTEYIKRSDLSKLRTDEVQNLSVEAVIQNSESAEQVYDLSETWPKGSSRGVCAREEGAWLFCYTAGASQRALANPLKLNNAARMHHETVLRFAKTFCSSYLAIDARRTRDVEIAQRAIPAPIKRDPYDLVVTDLLAISVASPILERQAQSTLARGFRQSYCLQPVMSEIFIRLESTGYRKHLSFVSLVDELSSNEVVAAGSLAAELAACRNGPACGAMGFMTMQVCQGLKNCKPEQTLFDIRRARTTPRVFQTAVEIANHYAGAQLPSK